MKTLTKPCRCQYCGWPMAIGSQFQWGSRSSYRVSGKTGLSRSNGVAPAHLDGQCLARIEVIEEAELMNEIESRFRS